MPSERAQQPQAIQQAHKTSVGRLQVIFILCPRSLHRVLSLSSSLPFPPQAGVSLMGFVLESSTALLLCQAVTLAHLAVGSSPQDANLSFLSQFTSLLFLHVTQHNSSCLDIFQCRGGAKQESNRQYRIRRGDKHRHCKVLPENILCSFRGTGYQNFPLVF